MVIQGGTEVSTSINSFSGKSVQDKFDHTLLQDIKAQILK